MTKELIEKWESYNYKVRVRRNGVVITNRVNKNKIIKIDHFGVVFIKNKDDSFFSIELLQLLLETSIRNRSTLNK